MPEVTSGRSISEHTEVFHFSPAFCRNDHHALKLEGSGGRFRTGIDVSDSSHLLAESLLTAAAFNPSEGCEEPESEERNPHAIAPTIAADLSFIAMRIAQPFAELFALNFLALYTPSHMAPGRMV